MPLLLQVIGKRLSIIGSTLRARSKPFKADLVQDFIKFAEQKFANKTFSPCIDTVFPIAEVRKAHEYMADKKNKGKIVLAVKA